MLPGGSKEGCMVHLESKLPSIRVPKHLPAKCQVIGLCILSTGPCQVISDAVANAPCVCVQLLDRQVPNANRLCQVPNDCPVRLSVIRLTNSPSLGSSMHLVNLLNWHSQIKNFCTRLALDKVRVGLGQIAVTISCTEFDYQRRTEHEPMLECRPYGEINCQKSDHFANEH